MEWSDLPYFLAVARTGQLARAARLIGTDATTVGRRIRRLEQVLGERLFDQSGQGQTLTPAGDALLQRAEAMSRIASEIGHESALDQSLTGSIRISVAEGFGTWFISRHIAAFADLHPQLEIDLVASSGFLNPTRRETDVAVLLGQPRRGPLISRRLTNYGLSLYAATTYLAAFARPAALSDLGAHRLIGYIPDILYAPELGYLNEFPGLAPPRLRSSSINAQHQMIAAGAGIGVLPNFIGDADPSIEIVLPDIKIERSFWLTTHQETHRFPQVRAFSDWLGSLAAANARHLLGGSTDTSG